jgi:signal transduction histidine kinase
VREVAGLHGGTIVLRNREGGGAIARLHLPLA